jgi:PAS domain S-box
LRHRTYNPAIYRKNSHALFACSQISGISLHKQTEEQKTQNLDCQKLYKKYKAIFECSGDPIVIAEIKGTDSRGRVIVEVNEAAIKHFGYSRSELLSHDTSFLHPEEEVNTLLPWVGQELMKNHHVFFEARHKCKDGRIVDVEIHSTLIAIDEPPIAIAVIRDISERKTFEKRSRNLHLAEQNLRQELENQIRQRTEFYKALVHELKTPLTPIVLNSEVLEDNLDGELKKMANNINIASMELLARINELYDMAKGEVGILKITRSWIYLDELVNELSGLFYPNLNYKHLTLKLFFSPDLSLIFADAYRLKQVLINLLNNSITFSPQRGQIILICTTNDNEIIIDVMDNGMGISDEDLQKLFKPYVLTKSDGLGLGLSLAKKIVELHNGEIKAESILGWGSKFTIVLPICNTQ